MNKNLYLAYSLVTLLLILPAFHCDNSTNPTESRGTITGFVSGSEGSPVYPAYIFAADSLVATTNESGKYRIASVDPGRCFLTCSALNFRDTTVQLQVSGGKTTTRNFNLTADTTTARVLGEFQDFVLFTEAVENNPAVKNMGAKQIFEEVTGATMQAQTLGYEIPPCQVIFSDSLLTISDPFGQFWFEIQCGTYPLTGSCVGYQSSTRIFKVLPETKNYLIFYLNR